MTFDDLHDGESSLSSAGRPCWTATSPPILSTVAMVLGSMAQYSGNHRPSSPYASTHVLSNAAHRSMTIEASAKFGWPVAGLPCDETPPLRYSDSSRGLPVGD